MSYLPLAELSTWKFHVMIFVALLSGKAKSILTFRLVVIIPACVCHCITLSSIVISFLISLTITIGKLHPISNKILWLLDPWYWQRIIITSKATTKCFANGSVLWNHTYNCSVVFPPSRQNTLHVIHLRGIVSEFPCTCWRRHDPSCISHHHADAPTLMHKMILYLSQILIGF